MIGFKDRSTAEGLRRLLQTERSRPKATNTVRPQLPMQMLAGGAGINVASLAGLTSFIVVPDADIAAATFASSTWTLGSGTCKVWKRDANDEDSQDPSASIANSNLKVFSEDGANISVRCFNPTPYKIKAGTVCRGFTDMWGDLYIGSISAPILRGISAATLTKGGAAANVSRYTPGTTSTSGITDSVKNELATIASGKVTYYFDDGSGTLYVVAAECPLT